MEGLSDSTEGLFFDADPDFPFDFGTAATVFEMPFGLYGPLSSTTDGHGATNQTTNEFVNKGMSETWFCRISFSFIAFTVKLTLTEYFQ
jgi:hypothetical protein